jgi:hypothetical protein
MSEGQRNLERRNFFGALGAVNLKVKGAALEGICSLDSGFPSRCFYQSSAGWLIVILTMTAPDMSISIGAEKHLATQ